MRILICTPLYPPDTEPSARYVQELATRLTSRGHTITVLAYGALLEPTVGVVLHPIPKEAPLSIRLMHYARALLQLQQHVDVIMCENGPSVELPFFLTSFFTHVKRILHDSDVRARAVRKRHIIFDTIHRAARLRADSVFVGTPLPRPELLPFTPHPAEAFTQYEVSWVRHLDALTRCVI